MYCVKCGKVLENDDHFCSGCGTVNPDYPAAGNAQDQNTNGFAGNQPFIQQPPLGQPYAQKPEYDGAQTISPYQTNGNVQQNIPPVYGTQENSNLGLYQQNTPATGNIPPLNNGPEINSAKDARRVVKAIATATAILAAGVIGIVSLSTFFGVKKELSNTNHNVTIKTHTEDNEVPTYTFNALNNIKEPEIIWETDDLTVTTQNIIHGGEFYSNAQLQLLIENKSDHELRVRSNEFSVNGYEFSGSFSESVPAGKSSTSSVYINIPDMEKLGIENINYLTMVLSAEDPDTYEKCGKSDLIAIETKNQETDAAFEPSQVLYEQYGIKIGYEGIEQDTYGSYSLYLYIENNTDEIIQFSLDDVSVNDCMINSSMYQTVYPGHRCITDSYISKSSMEKYKIKDVSDIKNIEFTVIGGHENKYDTIFNSDPLTVKTK